MDATSKMQLIACPSCGANNRVPDEKLKQGRVPVCGRCKTPLSGPVKPLIATDANFTKLVEQSPVPVLVDFWAAWCGPCRIVAPVMDQLAAELAGRVRVAKLNVDENKVIAARFKVQSIPTMIIFKDGQEVDRIVGAAQKAQILQHLNQYL